MKKYFDYAASTPISDEVLNDMLPWFTEFFANPSASHSEGERAAQAIRTAREIIAEKIGAMPSEIVFTSGASEANNLAIKGVLFQHLDKKGHIITSSIEHKCILNACSYLESIGFRVTYIEPNSYGVVDPKKIEAALETDTLLISIHHVNNELGTIQQIKKIGSIAFENSVLFHTDAAQSFCKLDIDVDDLNVDMLSLSGHKIYGPKGIGALYVRDARNSKLTPQIHGGGQEGGMRGGTSPTPLIVGLSSAVINFPHVNGNGSDFLNSTLKDYSYQRNGGDNVLPTIWNVTFSDNEEARRFFDVHDWYISQGSACNAMSNVSSHVLRAIGFSEEQARRTYRISSPPYHIK